MSAEPFTSVELWLRLIVGTGVCIGAPGWIALRCPRPARVEMIPLATAVGVILIAVSARMLRYLDLPFTPVLILPLASAIAFGLAWKRVLDPLSKMAGARAPRTSRGWLGLASLAGLLLLYLGYSPLSAPPHLHDASNHAFMVSRILETQSSSSDVVFGFPYAGLDFPYFMGWHTSAALVASVGGLEPYVATWLFPSFLFVMIPWAWYQLWHAWRIPRPFSIFAVFLFLSSPAGPFSYLSWGGFSTVVGVFLAPYAAMSLLAAWRTKTPLPALWSGLAVSAIVQVQVCSALLAVFSSAPAWKRRRPRAADLLKLLALLAPLTLLVGIDSYYALGSYSTLVARISAPLNPLPGSVMMALRSGGGGDPAVVLVVVGAAVLVVQRRYRAYLCAALAALLFFVGIDSVGDPVSGWFARVFYNEAPRVRVLLLATTPPLFAIGLWRVSKLIVIRRPTWARAVYQLLALLLLAPGVLSTVHRMQDLEKVVPFDASDYELARQIPGVVDEGSWVANGRDDGSVWAMHVAKRPFLRPTSWEFRQPEGVSSTFGLGQLLEAPWDQSVRKLRERGVNYVYVSDRRLEGSPWTSPPRSAFDRDERFLRRLSSDNSALFEILWSAGAFTPESF